MWHAGAGARWADLGDAGQQPGTPARCGILIGTAMGGMHTFSTAVEDLATRVLCPSPSAPLCGM